MAVVNKFNVNNKQVTLDADIIENMSANDVSYDDSFQYDENTVGDKLSELESQVIYDVTANNNGATFASLSELLSSENLSTLIPTSVRHGGMGIRFVQSSDNKYVQCRLMANSFTTDVTQWQGVDDKITNGSSNLITSSAVAELKMSVEENTDKISLVVDDNHTESTTKITEIASIVVLNGLNVGAPTIIETGSIIAATKLSGYISYYFIADKEMNIYADNYTGIYFALTVGRSLDKIIDRTLGKEFWCNGQNSVRYRASEGNLPTNENRLHVNSGDVVLFTLKSGNDADVHGMETSTSYIVKKDYTKSCGYIKYIGTSGIQSSTERLEILVPTGSGYTKYLFVHTLNENLNADVWRLGHAYATDRMFNEIIQLTIDGEWEVAVKLTGRSNFSGGYAHGNQVIQSAVFMLDGGAIDITTLTDYTPFVQFTVVENSYLYDPDEGSKLSDDESTKVKIAEHVSEYIFTIDGVKINQYLKWLIDATNVLDRAYLAMLPISKSTSNKLYTNKDYIAGDIAYGQIYGASRAVTYSSSKGAMFDFSVQDYPLGYLLITDNGGYAYHKEYFAVDDGLSSRPVGTIWKSTTLYKINYNV